MHNIIGLGTDTQNLKNHWRMRNIVQRISKSRLRKTAVICIIHLTHANIGVNCSCTQFIKKAVFVTTSHARIHISTASHARIRIRNPELQVRSRALRLNVQWFEIIITIVPEKTSHIPPTMQACRNFCVRNSEHAQLRH